MMKTMDVKQKLIDRKLDILAAMVETEPYSIEYFYQQGKLTEIDHLLAELKKAEENERADN